MDFIDFQWVSFISTYFHWFFDGFVVFLVTQSFSLICIVFWCPCWSPFWRQKLLQKVTKNGTNLGTALPWLSRVSPSRFQELYERCGKAIGIGIILSKEEGGTEGPNPRNSTNKKLSYVPIRACCQKRRPLEEFGSSHEIALHTTCQAMRGTLRCYNMWCTPWWQSVPPFTIAWKGEIKLLFHLVLRSAWMLVAL